MPQAASDAGHIGKQPRAIARDDGEIEKLAVGAQIELHGVLSRLSAIWK